MFLRKAIAILIIAGLLAIACALPSSVKMSNASDEELDRTCDALSKVNYDYYRMNVLDVGGRILEVAASIHTDHTGPDKTREYCEGR